MKKKDLASIENDINEVNELLMKNKTLQLKYPESEGVKANYRALEFVRDQLFKKREIRIEKLKRETVEIVLDGEEIINHNAPARLIGRFLNNFQEMVISIVRSSLEGKDSQGRVSNEVIREATYEVSAFSPGSFRIFLTSYASRSEQSTFGQTVAKDAIDSFTKLIECGDDIRLIKLQQERLGIVPIQKYKNLMGTIYQNKVNVKFNDVLDHKRRSNEVTRDQAKKIYDVIRKAEDYPPDEKTYDGTLVAVDIDKYEFGFVIAGESEERINGKFDKKVKENIIQNLEKFCTVKFGRYKKYHELKEDFSYEWELLEFR